MGCIKHSMMFEDQMTATFQNRTFPEEKKRKEQSAEGEGQLQSLNVETLFLHFVIIDSYT